MTKRILASGLLRTAANLAGARAGAGRPALADLRRATSTAYYALFHQIVRHGAFDFLPRGTEDEIAQVARWYSHTGIHAAAGIVGEAAKDQSSEHVRKSDRAGVISLRSSAGGTVPRELAQVADAFRSLQEARHRADYDGNYDPVRAVTLEHVAVAEEAVRSTRSMWTAGWSDWSKRPDQQDFHEVYACFLRLAMLRSGGPRAR